MRDSQGGLIGYAKVTRDLTQRRRADQALAQTNQELERFSYSVSHDLRAPLRAINGYAQALWEDHAARLDDEGKRLLAVIRDSAKLGGQLRAVADHRQEPLALIVEPGGVVLPQRLRVAVDGAERCSQIMGYRVAEPFEL